MRFREFKNFLIESSENVVVIGDSIAVGIGGQAPYAQGGISSQEVLNRVNKFIQSGKAKGSIVILSTGASNSAPIELENGTKQPGKIGNFPEQQIKALIDAGAKVAVVGTGSKLSAWFPATKFTNGSKYRVDLTGVNEKLAAAAQSYGAKFLGPLEEYDQGLHSPKGDGLHPFGAYKKLYQAGVSGASGSSVKLGPSNASPEKVPTKETGKKQDLVVGPPYPAEQLSRVKDIQTKLEKIGYSVGPTGIDGKFGPRTSSALSAFINDYNLSGRPDVIDDITLSVLDKVIAGTIPLAKSSTPVNQNITKRFPPLKQDAATQGKIGDLLNFIARYESGGNYNVVYGMKPDPNLTSMSISQVLNLQREHVKNGSPSSAAGRYQYIQNTLRDTVKQMGLNPEKTKFNEKTQDSIAIHTLRNIGLDNWLSGQMSDEQFLNKLAPIWAAIPTSGGKSFYSGDGLNKAGMTTNTALASLKNIKSDPGIATA